jgi:hypothetical protein
LFLFLLFFCPFFSVCGIPEVLNESDQEETTDAWGFEKPSASGISQTLKKGQKKSKNKNESDQEETTDAWGFEKPSTSGIPFFCPFFSVCDIPEALGFSNPHASVVSS